MAYFAPYVDAAGLHIPTYVDIRDDLIAQAKAIFGQDIYLGNDSQDYQYISALALKISDTLQAVQLAYNNRSPVTAIGSGLDSIVKINGLRRKSASYSTCQVTLSGTAGTTITNGIVADVSGNNWSLPTSVTILSAGTVTVSAVCQTIGDITALPGNISKIVTPTKGWTGVANAVAAVPGQPVEADSQLRARQSISTANPSQTIVEGITGAISAVSGVTRLQVYENDTNLEDSNGLPPHSLTAVVEGGTDDDIANAIYTRKTPGAYTNGNTEVYYTNLSGQTSIIRFDRPEYKTIAVTANIKALVGYTTETTTAIKENIAAYLNSLVIGQSLTVSALWGAALASMPNLKKPTFSVASLNAGILGDPQGTVDIPIAYNQVTLGDVANIVVNVT